MSAYKNNAMRQSRAHYNHLPRNMPAKEFYVFFGMGTELEGKYDVVHASSAEKAMSAALSKYGNWNVSNVMLCDERSKEIVRVNKYVRITD